MTKICYHLSLLLLFFDPGSEIRDPGQCCGSETFISDPFSDPDTANSEFRIRIRIRIRNNNHGWKRDGEELFAFSGCDGSARRRED